ncbi:MAG: type II toxin-antitoxin system Phd/YefM family antitoxin [Candidatus Binatia bacterium]
MEVNVHEAKTHFSKLLRRAAAGEEIIISRAGEPVAKIVPIGSRARRRFGVDHGVFEVPDDFDAPLPDTVLDTFES